MPPFSPGRGIDSIVQQGSVAYQDGERKAWGERATYTPADQILVLAGSPRAVDGGMTTTGQTMRLNRATGDAFVDGDVKSTYSDLKPQPNGALLASASPIHVTARTMTAPTIRQSPFTPEMPACGRTPTSSGRLPSNSTAIVGPFLPRELPPHCVSTVLVQVGKEWKSHTCEDHLGATQLCGQRAPGSL